MTQTLFKCVANMDDDKFMNGCKGIEKKHSATVKASNFKEERSGIAKWSAQNLVDFLSATATDPVLTTSKEIARGLARLKTDFQTGSKYVTKGLIK